MTVSPLSSQKPLPNIFLFSYVLEIYGLHTGEIHATNQSFTFKMILFYLQSGTFFCNVIVPKLFSFYCKCSKYATKYFWIYKIFLLV